MRICIDPSHGGRDKGAVNKYLTEKDINLKLALLFGDILAKNNISVVYTRNSDKYVDL